MVRSDIIARLANKHLKIASTDMEQIVKAMAGYLSNSLAQGKRIEVRRFGSFAVHHRKARSARNPKTGDLVNIPERFVPRFRASYELKRRVNRGVIAGKLILADSDEQNVARINRHRLEDQQIIKRNQDTADE